MSNEALTVHRYGNPDAPPLVLVHGVTDDGTCWPDAVLKWGFHYDIHAIDQRGHGASPRFTAEAATDAHRVWVDDLLDLLADFDGRAVVVGHSLGGYVGLRAALASPDLVRALVVEDPARPNDTDAPDPTFVAGILAELDRFPDQTAAELDRMKRETPWSDTEILAWAQARSRVDRVMIERGLRLPRADWEQMFQSLRVPTLLVLPSDGGMGPDPTRLDNPLVERVVVPEAGHCIRRDNPAGYHDVVDPFLAAHRVTVETT